MAQLARLIGFGGDSDDIQPHGFHDVKKDWTVMKMRSFHS